ncbi:hypothetical protein HF1_04140 [Mycoplasma haemofelis str. Langford 1]|uniref:Uncharacterized protein n=1 Tax=Mycoplasma haemofelis (strain Langford 1) TaxID=941640 RepID=E8ZH01_MYCHL|nr:hypothetical protein [Mycoplasma haemofelis]CBY92422.1 hypothetical protein HF1_04140 [Mycoplasma haemofelis str. Langford 1]
MNSIHKLGMLGLGGAATATSAYAGINYFQKNKPTISEHLTDNKYLLISSIDNLAHLKLQWEAEFKSAKEKIKTLIGFTKDSDEEGGQALKEWCESKIKEDYSQGAKHLQEVKSYCVLRKVESQLTRNNKKILTHSSEDSGKWDKTYEQRKKTAQLSPRSQVGLEGSWPDGDTKTQDLPKIKKWCELKVQSYFLAHEDTYTNVYNWCTEDGVNVNSPTAQ